MPPAANRTLLTLALVGLTACGSGPGADTGGGAGLDGPDRALAFTREPLYTVGGSEAEGWAAFGDVDDVGFDADGNLYVLDSQASQVHVVAQDGSLLRSMGEAGQGPGELGQTRGMTVFPDGTVAVFDIMKFSLVVYGPDGEWQRDVRIDPAATGLLSPPFMPLAYETVLAQVGGRLRIGPDSGSEPEPGRSVVRVPLGAEAGDPEVLFRAWEPPPPGGTGDETTLSSAGGSRISFQMERMRGFTPELRIATLPDGRVLAADSTTYRISLFGADGVLERELTRPIPPIEMTPSIEEKERARRLADLDDASSASVRVLAIGGSGGGGGGGTMQAADVTEMMRGRIEEMIFYPEIQVIERLAADWDSRIWVQRASGEPGEPGPTDVITPDGGYLGTLAPDGLRIPRAFGPGGLGVWVERDEYDAERLVVARITPAG